MGFAKHTFADKAIELNKDISEIIGPLDVDSLLVELSNKF
ncbi:MAG: hypothetical protein ACI8RW_000132 [Porticoccaceae bacterium]|jgi:hypothetical protein